MNNSKKTFATLQANIVELKRDNLTYQTHMESHTQIHFSIEVKLTGAGT